MYKSIFLVSVLLLGASLAFGQKKKPSNSSAETKSPANPAISTLNFRLVGPALTSGRIADMVVHPDNHDVWYIAAASGGVWKTENHGTTFQPIFDNYGSYSIGCLAMDPSNSNTIWVGTGENNNQRAVAYGDGVYKSNDGGKSFTNVGLKSSEHIGKIIVHPSNSDVVWVAAYGPVWSAGGERGVYKTTDGGKTWKRTLFVSDNTGVAEIAIDPTNPNVLYASAHQRRRREWTYIGGGPESGLYKSTDGGETWQEINQGLPKKEMGRIGIAVSPVDPNYIYAIVEAKLDKGGFYRSTNRGESWTKMSSYSTSGNYYQEIVCDLTDKDKVFAMDTWLHHTENGGKSFQLTGEDKKHVDNHCMWIDPNNPDHWIVGCDGGLYETYNHAGDWKYYANLPLIQFYKVTTDNSKPFYYIYGGTQDNNSMGGPSQTISSAGVLNSDWFITNGGDGFESAVDPTNPNIVYAQAQYGWLVRYDRSSGERVPIQPMPEPGEDGYRWNWDAPLLVSPHNPKRIYFAANKVFRSENRGDDWTTISPDLSQQIDRNKLEVMGQVWSFESVMKNGSTTIYGNIVALDESPKKEGLLYAGTDDGAIHVSEDGGKSWRKQTTFSGIPANTRVNAIHASPTNEQVVYAVFNNHRSGDFKPYLLMSSDKGRTWRSITSNLPERGSVFCVEQDFIDERILFVGTEFGAFVSLDAGANWTKLGGLPTIAVYDLDIQQDEHDLVAATFGRGMYVLDDYRILRDANKGMEGQTAKLYPVSDALLYVESSPLGLTGTGSQGGDLWNAENPAFGAQFNLQLKEEYKTIKDLRREADKKKEEAKEAVYYPALDSLRKENAEEAPKLFWTIRDIQGNAIYRTTSSPKKGMNSLNWNLRSESSSAVRLSERKPGRYEDPDVGLLVVPGQYTVEVDLSFQGRVTALVAPTKFNVVGLNNQTLLAKDQSELDEFRKKVAETSRLLNGTGAQFSEYSEQLKYMKHAIQNYPQADLNWLEEISGIKEQMDKVALQLWGDGLKSSLEMETAPSLSGRLGITEYQVYANTTGVTATQKRNLAYVAVELDKIRVELKAIYTRIDKIEQDLITRKVPYMKSATKDWKLE